MGNDVLHAVQDEVRPSTGGPVGRFPDPSSLIYSKMSSPDDSYQPLVTGPLGANVLSASNDAGRPTAGGPLGRPSSLDPMGPRAMLSLGDGNQPASISPVGRPWIPEQPGNQVVEPDYERSTQTRSESESDTGALDSVIRTEGEVHTGRVNTSVANGQTDPSVVPFSSDPVMYGPEKQMYRTKRGSESAAGIPVPVIRTGSGVQTDGVNIGMVNGQTDSSVASPSSDSGVHSLGEQWENMSTCSGNSGSILTIKTFYGSVASQADKQNPQDTRKVVFCKGATCGENDSMSYLSMDSHNSDIAAMSDFSDEEDGPQGEVRPNIRTECVSDDSIKKESNSCDRSVPDMSTKGVGSNSLDPNDKEYWTKFRLLTKQAFLLDNDKLSESDYPDAVKELVLKSRLMIMEIIERDDTRLEQCKEGETSDYSDDECESSISDDDFRDRLEDYKDWHYNRSPVVDILTADEDCRAVRNAENNDGHGPTFGPGIEDKIDLCSELGDRAKLDLSPTEAIVKIDIFGVDYVTNGDITVNRRDSAGDSDTNEDENIMVSMITVDVTRGSTSAHNNNPPEIRDCVFTECEKQHELSAHMDLELCKKDSLQNMTSNCFGVCGLTHRFNSPELEWCGECVDKLMWAILFHVWFLLSLKTDQSALMYSLKEVVYTPIHGVYRTALLDHVT